MSELSEKTKIPLGVAIAAIGAAAVWMTTMHLKAEAQEARSIAQEVMIREVIVEQKTYNGHMQNILAEISGIKGELKRIKR
jgi:hypothetical protein